MPQSLVSPAFTPLAPGSIRPRGWLLRQLEIQRDGLTGRLDEFWPDVRDSGWLGGPAEPWERGPYWLDGVVPLAFLLDDGRLKAKAKRWIDHILTTQHDDGWLGPIAGDPQAPPEHKTYDTWPRYVVFKALTQWHEATGDPRVIPAMRRCCRKMHEIIRAKPLAEWARSRWAELVLSVHWLYDRTGEARLLDLAALLHEQGTDWAQLADDFPYKDKQTWAKLKQYQAQSGGIWINEHFDATHGVNVAMGVKAAGVWFRQSHDPRDRTASSRLLAQLDRYHGQPNGMYSCDEHLAGTSPSQGTELCTVVELMFSLECLIAALGDPLLADRLELIAFNALPATLGPGFMTHQYDQQVNQVVCRVSEDRIYTNNGPEANLFGLEPNFGCCLANMHQGWPKLATHLWMTTADHAGLVAISYAPCEVVASLRHGRVRVEIETNYPFEDTIRLTVHGDAEADFPLLLRIPAWAEGATVTIGGQTTACMPGTFHELRRTWRGGATALTLRLPMRPRLTPGHASAASIHVGPLLMALNIDAEWRKLRDRPPTADYELYPTSKWAYALAEDERTITGGAVKPICPAEGPGTPFTPDAAPVALEVRAVELPDWPIEHNAAADPPEPVPSVEPTLLTLTPYGCTHLRVAAFPVVEALTSVS